ncbi:nucleoside 2-deoxyribosyltransferase [Marinobacter sp. F4206]|uniref:nucleoside 2-deoxyribosyltransferase n=1 Tax=Marinobacter sp. F4206 TaxID=2861777 RepID=UPI001C5F2243|nr:nucleoside 2-deoxyribosyltransferase [Marinobacter sp. F4206]MBW4933223.1 nucleoside 2-deoxyribosyltransferase [Marinobacter sp. F4206]
MTKPQRIYLAGPEVFFPETEHRRIVSSKKRLLATYGLEGVDPLDTTLEASGSESSQALGFRIYRANRELMANCQGVIANLTPFRGISADPGTVFEVGYMIAQGKAAFGYTMDPRNYFERANASPTDSLGHTIENFGLSDNLMIECGIVEAGGEIIRGNGASQHLFYDDDVFEHCVRTLIQRFA